jgi:hypothetical protein
MKTNKDQLTIKDLFKACKRSIELKTVNRGSSINSKEDQRGSKAKVMKNQ